MPDPPEAAPSGTEALLEKCHHQRIGTEIVDAYRRQPQTDEELAGLDLVTSNLIEEEPW
jgi:hypothetical protein